MQRLLSTPIPKIYSTLGLLSYKITILGENIVCCHKLCSNPLLFYMYCNIYSKINCKMIFIKQVKMLLYPFLLKLKSPIKLPLHCLKVCLWTRLTLPQFPQTKILWLLKHVHVISRFEQFVTDTRVITVYYKVCYHEFRTQKDVGKSDHLHLELLFEQVSGRKIWCNYLHVIDT